MAPTDVNEKPPLNPLMGGNHAELSAVRVVVDPWTFIGLLFAVQVVGSVWIALSWRLPREQVAWPIALLVLGCIHAFVVRFWLRSSYAKWKHYWMPALLYCGFIFSLSNTSFKAVKPSVDTNFFHPLEYAALGLFLCWAGHLLLRSGRPWKLALRVFAGGMVFALLDELHQSFIPRRTASFTDLLLDSIGLAVGIGVFFLTGRLWVAWEGSWNSKRVRVTSETEHPAGKQEL